MRHSPRGHAYLYPARSTLTRTASSNQRDQGASERHQRCLTSVATRRTECGRSTSHQPQVLRYGVSGRWIEPITPTRDHRSGASHTSRLGNSLGANDALLSLVGVQHPKPSKERVEVQTRRSRSLAAHLPVAGRSEDAADSGRPAVATPNRWTPIRARRGPTSSRAPCWPPSSSKGQVLSLAAGVTSGGRAVTPRMLEGQDSSVHEQADHELHRSIRRRRSKRLLRYPSPSMSCCSDHSPTVCR
jgi:hypothetical protein